MSYLRFVGTIATSTVVMFVLMYLNTYAWEHVFWSEARVYMAILMGATTAVIMLAWMLGMYENTMLNVAIFVGAALVFALALWLVRSQATVSGVSYVRAMIPHHSIAIMTSERAQITDPRVRRLADEIIEAQRREIAEMRYLIADLEGREDTFQPEIYEDEAPEIGSIAEALEERLIATLDPAPVHQAEADRVLEPGPGCSFAGHGVVGQPAFGGVELGQQSAARAVRWRKLKTGSLADRFVLRPAQGWGSTGQRLSSSLQDRACSGPHRWEPRLPELAYPEGFCGLSAQPGRM